jgi:hypothetical protein
MYWINFVKQEWDFRVAGNLGINDSHATEIGFLQAFLQRIVVAQSGNATIKGTSAYGYYHFAVLPKFFENMHIVGVANASFYHAQVASANVFNVGDGSTVKFDLVN